MGKWDLLAPLMQPNFRACSGDNINRIYTVSGLSLLSFKGAAFSGL